MLVNFIPNYHFPLIRPFRSIAAYEMVQGEGASRMTQPSRLGGMFRFRPFIMCIMMFSIFSEIIKVAVFFLHIYIYSQPVVTDW